MNIINYIVSDIYMSYSLYLGISQVYVKSPRPRQIGRIYVVSNVITNMYIFLFSESKYSLHRHRPTLLNKERPRVRQESTAALVSRRKHSNDFWRRRWIQWINKRIEAPDFVDRQRQTWNSVLALCVPQQFSLLCLSRFLFHASRQRRHVNIIVSDNSLMSVYKETWCNGSSVLFCMFSHSLYLSCLI